MRLIWAVLLAFTAVLVALNVSYSIADKRPPTYDDAWYLETSLNFYHRLTEGGLRAFVPAYAASFGTKAPLISVLPLPFYLIFGTTKQAALLVNSAFVIITNIYLFLLVRRLFSEGVALAAVLFYQTMPLAYGLSRAFMADYGLAALVIVWMYYLVASERLSRPGINVLLGILLGLGLLMKILFPAFIAGPVLLALIWRQQVPWRSLAVIGLVGGAIASTWYAFHLREILTYAWQGAYGEIGEQYGSGGLRNWAILVINRGMSFYYAAALAILGIAALFFGAKRNEKGRRGLWLMLAWLVPPLAATAAGTNREIRFVIPLLPVFAVLLAAAVFRLGRTPAAQWVLTGALVLFPLRLYAELSFHTLGHGGHDHDHPVQAGPFVVFSDDLGWARRPDAEGAWEQQRILEAIRNLGGPPPATPRYVVVGVEHPYLNANLLSYLNAYARYPYLFTSLGYAEPSVERAIERVNRVNARFLVMVEGIHSHELVGFLNQVNHGVQKKLDRGELPFRHRAGVTLTHGIRAHIYERKSLWERFAPDSGSPPAPSRPMPVDFRAGMRFLGYDWRRKADLGEITYYWSAQYPIAEDFRVNVVFRRNGQVALVQDHYVCGGEHPFFEWKAGEVIKETMTVWLPPGGTLEARLWLTAWGIGEPHQISGPQPYVHESVIPLRLEE